MNYASLINEVLKVGVDTPSRFGETKELLGLNWTSIPGVVPLRKGHNRKLGYMELLQVMAGVFDDEYMALAAPNATHALFTSQMAGGPRVALQPQQLLETLRTDPNSRQCVIFWGRPADSFSSNLPCTVQVQFLLRNGVLHAIASMRSWDLIRGLPYDLTIFGGLQMTIAQLLGVSAGTLSVNAGSAHIYKKDLEIDRMPIGKNLRFSPQFDEGTPWESVVRTCVEQYKKVLDWPTRAPWMIEETVEDDNDDQDN